MNRLSINTYTIHELIGIDRYPSFSGGVLVDEVDTYTTSLDLLDLGKELSSRGIGAVDFCFNHLPSVDEEFLHTLHQSLVSHDVRPFCLLVDFGDLTQADSERRDAELAYISTWIRYAKTLGASHVRVQAGGSLPTDLDQVERMLSQVVRGYSQLADVAESVGMRLLTENLGDFLRRADTIVRLLDRMDDRLGLVVDFGNGRIPGDYEELRMLLPHAESIHAKPYVSSNGDLLADDFCTCVRLAEEAGFTAPYTLVYRGPEDAWTGLEKTRDLVLDCIQ